MGCMRALRGLDAAMTSAYFRASAPALAVDHDGDTALERRRSFQLQDAKPGAAPGDDVLEGLGGPTEAHRGRGLALGDVDAAVLRVVKALEQDEMPATVDDGDDHVPAVLRGLACAAAIAFWAWAKVIGAP